MLQYIVKAKIIKGKIGEEYIFESFDKTFENEIPIVARKEAFEYYADMMTFLKESSTDENDFKKKIIDEETYYEIVITNNRMRHYKESGLSLYVVLNNEELLLQADGDFSINEWDSIVFNLNEEYQYYTTNNFKTEDFEAPLTYYSKGEWEDGYTENEPETYTILKTDANWTGKEKELWWDEERKKNNELEAPREYSVEDLIALGEGKNLEFKSALVYNFKTNKGGIGIKYIIAKSINSFLNTDGGYLFIGVSDDKEIIGLAHDFSLAEGKNEQDFFKLEFDEMINRFFSSSIHGKLITQFFTIDEKTICLVKIEKSDRPIFLKNQQEKEFWIRGEASTRRLLEIPYLIDHCFHTWLKKE